MTVFLDIAVSWLVRATMITAMLGLTLNMNDALYQSNQHAQTSAAISVAAEVITQDLNLAGLHVTSGSTFSSVTTQEMWFYGDLNNGGIPETIHYYVSNDPNTGLYSLYRSVNRENHGQPMIVGSNFTSVAFTYYDAKGAVTTDPSNITSIRVKLIAKVHGTMQGFTTAAVDFRISPANI